MATRKKGSLDVSFDIRSVNPADIAKQLKATEKLIAKQTHDLKQSYIKKEKAETALASRSEKRRIASENEISKKRMNTHKKNVEGYAREGLTFKEGRGPSMKNAIGLSNSVFQQAQTMLDKVGENTDWDEGKAREHVKAKFPHTDLAGLNWNRSKSANMGEQVKGFNEKYSGGIAQMPALQKHVKKMEEIQNPLKRIDNSIANTVDAIKNYNKSFINSVYDVEDGIGVFGATVMHFTFETSDAMRKTSKYLQNLGFDTTIDAAGGLQVQGDLEKDPDKQRTWAMKLAHAVGVPASVFGKKEPTPNLGPTLHGMPVIDPRIAELGRIGERAAGGKEGFDMESRAVKDMIRRTGLRDAYKKEVFAATSDEGLQEWVSKTLENDKAIGMLERATGISLSKGPQEMDPLSRLKGEGLFKHKGIMGQLEDTGKKGFEGFMSGYGKSKGAGGGFFQNLAGGLKGGASGAMGAAGGPIGMAIMGLQKVLEVGVEFIERIWNFMIKSSPQLQATIKLTMRGLMLFMRPFGDVIAMAMRPMARWLIRLNRDAMRAGRAAGKPGSEEFQNAYMKSWMDGFLGGFMENLIDPLVAAITKVLPTLTEVFATLAAIVAPIIAAAVVYAIGVTIVKILVDVVKFVWDLLTKTIPQAIMSFLVDFTSGLMGIVLKIGLIAGEFISGLWNSFLGFLGGIKTWLMGIPEWLWNSITDALSGIWDWLKGIPEWIWNAITGAIKGIGKGAGDWLKGLVGLQSGGIVTSPTAALIGEHGPEAVIPLSKMGGMGATTVTLTWHQNAPIYGVAELEKTVERALDQYFRTKVSTR